MKCENDTEQSEDRIFFFEKIQKIALWQAEVV